MASSSCASAIIFPHANGYTYSLPLFVAAFIVQFDRLHGRLFDPEVDVLLLPIHAQAENAAVMLDAHPEFIHSFEWLCRCLSGYTNTMQATDVFFAENRLHVEKVVHGADSLYGTGRLVNAARLTDPALKAWMALSDLAQKDLLIDAEAILTSDQDAENEGTVSGEPPILMPAVSTPSCLPAATPADYIACHIQNAPMPVYYRKKLIQTISGGWDDKLKAYFWPSPACDYAFSSAKFSTLITNASAFTAKVIAKTPWTPSDEADAIAWANDVFAWGGVPQKNNTHQNARAVIEAALAHNAHSSAPMNSGWTKVAAIASEHFPTTVVRSVIWDSRVSNAIISALDPHFAPHSVPGIGIVGGRGGSRPRTFSRKWPNGYQSWSAQVAGSALVEEIRKVLNSGSYPKMPLPGGGTSDWTTRGVEMVLFMFGY